MKNSLKITALTALSLSAALILTGCTPPDSETPATNGAAAAANFDSKPDITVLPVWDITNLTPGMLGGEADPQVTTEVTDDGVTHYVPPVDTYLESYIFFENPATKCNISGRIGAVEAYKADRGDLYNSKETLYNLVTSDQKPLANEGTVQIDEQSYVTGDYTTGAENGGNTAHRSAIRVFSTPITVGENAFPADFNYQSDPTKGLPTITIDYSCPSADLINEEEWNKAISTIFTLDWTGGPSVTDVTPSPIPQTGDNLPADPGTEDVDLSDPNQNPGATPAPPVE